MKQIFTLFTLCFFFNGMVGQTVIDFENFNLPIGTSLNGSDGNGEFYSGLVVLPNMYDSLYGSWSKWAISAATDTLTAGFTNDLSAAAGTGAEGTTTYAVSLAFEPTRIKMTDAALGATIAGLYVTNNTYAKLSMQEGDAFAKKFGGETGEDPDFFLLTIQKYFNGELSEEKVDVYLADYRFEDQSKDYILSDWEFVDLSILGATDSLVFSLSSSDIGQFGMNTPAYFCVDQITFAETFTTPTKEVFIAPSFEVFPNPTTNFIQLNWQEKQPAKIALLSMDGRELLNHTLLQGNNQLDVQHVPAGIYTLKIIDRLGWKSTLVVIE